MKLQDHCPHTQTHIFSSHTHLLSPPQRVQLFIHITSLFSHSPVLLTLTCSPPTESTTFHTYNLSFLTTSVLLTLACSPQQRVQLFIHITTLFSHSPVLASHTSLAYSLQSSVFTHRTNTFHAHYTNVNCTVYSTFYQAK